MMTRVISIETDGSGDFTWERRLVGVVEALAFDTGDLSTPDLTVTDGVFLTDILDVTAVAADTVYRPVGPVVDNDGVAIADVYQPYAVMGSLKVVISGGGASKTGTLKVLFQ